MSEELKSDVMASMVARWHESNKVVKQIEIQKSWIRGLSMALGFEKTYQKFNEIIDDDMFWSGLYEVGASYGRRQLSERINLDIQEISERGIAEALGRRAGFVLRSLHDVDIVAEDLLAAAAERIAARMGWTLDRALRTVEAVREELQRRAAALIEAKVPGLVLHDIFNVDKVIEDCERWAAKKIEEKTGLTLTDIRDVEKTKRDLLRWADTECRRRLGIAGTGGGLKMTKKAIRNRLAQRRFYAAHGNRHYYETGEA